MKGQANRGRRQWLGGLLALAALAGLVALPVGRSGLSSASAAYYYYNNNPGPPATLVLTPAAMTNPVGTSHTVTATVTDTFGNPVMGTTVRFSVSGSVTTSGSCTTDVTGQCSFTYSGPLFPGADTISAFADTNGNGSLDVGEPQGAATKTWALPTSTPGHVTGGGQIETPDDVAFGLTAQTGKRGPKGECAVVDLTTNRKIKCLDVNALVVVGNQAMIWGDAKDNGVRTVYAIQVTDNGEPGRGRDTFAIQTASGFGASGTLTSGNIEVD